MALAERLREAGHRLVDGPGEPEAYVINTCTVTGEADRECRRLIRRVAARHPRAVVVVTGCYAVRDPRSLESLPGVGLVDSRRETAAVLAALAPRTAPPPGLPGPTFPRITSFPGRTRAFVKIQDGCDNRCAYCVVWQVRGPNRSLEAERILAQVAELERNGYREVVLSGVHLGSWGADQPGDVDLARLLEALAAPSPGPRLRLSSIEPQEFGPGLVSVVSSHPRICRHFHLPLQSGSETVLARMNRRASAATCRDAILRLAEAVPGCGLGTDLIAGFPGETETEFEETVALVEALPFSYLHVFTFSPRPGTVAAALPGQVPRGVAEARSRVLRDLGRRKSQEYRRRFLGETVEVLVETTRHRPTGLLKGLTDTYLPVLFRGDDALGGTMARVRLERLEGGMPHGGVVA
jgi:threonylcarbamoyladenosine tRNA methylthiotransferase MtaB